MEKHGRNQQKVVLFYILWALTSVVYGQSDVVKILSDYAGNVNQFDTINSQEKVYLHFDNTGYFIGDTIWFKAYTVLARDLTSTSLSKVLRVELLTPQGEVVDDKRLYIRNGQCHGEFVLRSIYESGFYEVRAYTRAMLNWGEECVFSRVFPVYDTPEKAGNYTQRKMNPYSVSDKRYKREKVRKEENVNLAFYPEGGYAVTGIPSCMAFKATGTAGEDIDISGVLYNEKGNQVASLETIHQGMGRFEFVPELCSYKAEVMCEGKKYTIPVEYPVLSDGYVLRVNNLDKEQLVIKLQKSAGIPSDTVAVCVMCRGKVCSATMITSLPYAFQLPKSKLPTGCLQITAYNSKGDVLAERLAFNSVMHHSINVEIKGDKKDYKPFDKVNMEINLSNENHQPVEASFSLSIRDAATQIYTNYEENILTNLLLSSDVRGYIAHPMDYFECSDSLTLAKLDLLMLVQGWRRYNWQLMANVMLFKPLHYAEKGLQAFGKVVSLIWKKPLVHAKVRMWTYDRKGRHLLGKTITDKDGKFYFTFTDSIYPVDKWTMGIEITDRRGSRLASRVMLDRQFSPVGRSYTLYDVMLKDTVFSPFHLSKASINEMQILNEVVVEDRNKYKTPSPDVIIDVEKMVSDLQDKDESYPESINQFLTWYVPEYNPYQSGRYKNLPIRISVQYPNGKECKKYSREESLSSDVLSQKEILSPEEVSRVEIYYKDPYVWQKLKNRKSKKYSHEPLSPSAFVRIIVYDDSFHGKYKKGIRHTIYYCYSQTKEFYHVDWSKAIPGDVDYRRTLYWNPDVKTDSTGKANIHFYNNGTCSKMNITLEGIDGNGGLIEYSLK